VIAPASTVTEAVFVVGVSRSGTTLMRRILEGSSQVAICSENHYLGHLIGSEGVRHRLAALGDLRDDAVVERVVNYIYEGGIERSSRLRGVSRQWIWTRRQIPRAEFRDRLLHSDRTERAVFEVMMRSYADKRGKPIMGEKTPAHVRYVDTLMAWFPRGRVVHMMRDPRAIYLSELRRRRIEPGSLPYQLLRRTGPLFAGAVLVETTLAWLESVVRLRRHRRRYRDRYMLLRFEDLVAEPETQIGRLCDFLGIPVEESMLDQRVVSKGQNAGAAGFDKAAATRWRGALGPVAAAWLWLWTARQRRSLGYGD
jgi:hypothetical protein